MHLPLSLRGGVPGQRETQTLRSSLSLASTARAGPGGRECTAEDSEHSATSLPEEGPLPAGHPHFKVGTLLEVPVVGS